MTARAKAKEIVVAALDAWSRNYPRQNYGLPTRLADELSDRIAAALDAADGLMAAGARLDVWATTVHLRGADVQFNDLENMGHAIDAWRAALDAYRLTPALAPAERSEDAAS